MFLGNSFQFNILKSHFKELSYAHIGADATTISALIWLKLGMLMHTQ